MTKSKLKRARENSHMAINILAEKPDKERTADDNFIINEALAIWERTGEIRYLADFLVMRL